MKIRLVYKEVILMKLKIFMKKFFKILDLNQIKIILMVNYYRLIKTSLIYYQKVKIKSKVWKKKSIIIKIIKLWFK